jgi:hypothetical protein
MSRAGFLGTMRPAPKTRDGQSCSLRASCGADCLSVILSVAFVPAPDGLVVPVEKPGREICDPSIFFPVVEQQDPEYIRERPLNPL